MESEAMIPVVRIGLMLGALFCVGLDRSAQAGLFFHHDEGTPPPGCPRAIDHTHERAGFPLLLSPCAKPANTPAYVGYYVGGGTGCMGSPRRVEDGTWGRDYQGHWIPRHVMLQWSHGRLYQGGIGAYESDGHPVPDVIGLTASKLRTH
jgi:hypothetical protein